MLRSTLCTLAVLALPAALVAQEDMAPPTIVMTTFQCDMSRIGDIMSEMEAQLPVWEQAKADGMAYDMGSFVHSWADEWNVGRYIIAENMEAAVAANAATAQAANEQGLTGSALAEACPFHRDRFYLGASNTTTPEGAQTGGNPTIVFSMYRCNTAQMGDVLEEYEAESLPVYQQLVDDGQLRSAGSFAHYWADEWNVGMYWIAESIQSFMDAMDASGPMFAEDSGAALAAACPVHRDNFYTLGPRTGS